MLGAFLLSLAVAQAEPTDRFVVLSEFQVWADASGPEVFEELSKLYIARGHSHVFNLYPRYDYFVWDAERMKHWVDEAVHLGAFNVFCIGDDTRTGEGYLFTADGLNPRLADVFRDTVRYAHERRLMVAVEPHGLPQVRDREHFRAWLDGWVGRGIPAGARPDIIKLSLEWFGAYRHNPAIADEVEAFVLACEDTCPDVLVYIDSIGGGWRRPQPFHRWLLHRFPGTILSHYLGTEQADAFRSIGARNMMVQINPSEIAGAAGQFFIYHDKTVAFLKDAMGKRVRYLSLAGVNFGYNRYNYDLFLDVVRPHLDLAPDVAGLRQSIVPDRIVEPASKEDVAGWLSERGREARGEPPVPLNSAGRPAFFSETPEPGLAFRYLATIGDGKTSVRLRGAHTDPPRRSPVQATFGVDFGEARQIRTLAVAPCLHPDEAAYVATDFRLEYRSQGTWRTLPGGAFRENSLRELELAFEPIEADAVRIVIESQTDDGKGNYRACCQELRAE